MTKSSETKIILFLIILLFFTSCKNQNKKISFSGEAQGGFYNITYYDKQGRNFQKAVDSILDEINHTASMYEPSSILSKINKGDTNVNLNDDFIAIYNLATEISKKTGGAFDITVGPLVNVWGFGLKNRTRVDSAMIDSLLKYVGYEMTGIKNNKFYKKYPEIQIDFNAIAQGYSVDKISLFFESKGINNYIVEIGGEVRAAGKKPDGSSWIVGIDKPDDNLGAAHDLKAKVTLDNMSVSTSGNYRKFYIENGIKYSHTINTFTGYPVNHSLLSASVFHKNCATADAYATAFMVMGVEKAKEFLKKSDERIQVYLIYSDKDGKMQTYMSDGLKNILKEN